MNADADRAGLHVAFPDHEHGVHFQLFGALDLSVDLIGALVDLGADLMRAQLVQDRHRIINELCVVADCEDADLLGRQPQRKIARVMFD